MGSEIIVEFKGSAKEVLDALDQIKGKSADMSKQLEILGAVSAAVFAGGSTEVYASVEAYGKQQAAVNNLTQSMQAQGVFSQELRNSYVETAEALEKKTGVDSASILSGQAMLQTMVGQIPISKELTEGIVNLAARTGKDLNSAFEEVGQAINGKTKGLQAMGIVVDSTADSQTRLAEITQQLSQNFADAAEAQTEGLGSLKLLHTSYDALQKKIGEEFAPAVEAGVHALTGFFNLLGQHQELVNLIASLATAAVLVGGLTASVALGGIAFLKLKEALAIANVAMDAMEITTKGLIGATGIGLLVIVISEVYLHWSTIWPAMQGIFAAAANNIGTLAGGVGKILFGAFSLRLDYFQEGLNQIKAAFAKGVTDFQQVSAAGNKAIETQTKDHTETQSATLKAAAEKRAAMRRDEDALRIATAKAQNELLAAETEKDSAASIALKKQEVDILVKLESNKNQAIKDSLREQLAEVRQLEADQRALDLAQEATYDDKLTAMSKTYQKMSEADQLAFDKKHQTALQATIQTEKTTREKAAQDEIAIAIASNNQLLSDQQKYGAAYAAINQVMHTAVIQGSSKAFGDLQALTASNNDALKAIGKAASIAQITIKTAESAMDIFAGFSTIPFVGYALGVAGAAAAVAFGGEQIGQVMSAADGGLMSGGIPGLDSIPTMTMPGELVVPTKNFEEVVGAVQNQRQSQSGGQSGQTSSQGYAVVQFALKDNLMDFIETKIIQRQRMGISLLPKLS